MPSDLNNDGVPEIIVVDEIGHRTPFYSHMDGASVVYLPSGEMARLMPDLRLDYDGIERDVNTNDPF